jgi:hypothetical protein
MTTNDLILFAFLSVWLVFTGVLVYLLLDAKAQLSTAEYELRQAHKMKSSGGGLYSWPTTSAVTSGLGSPGWSSSGLKTFLTPACEHCGEYHINVHDAIARHELFLTNALFTNSAKRREKEERILAALKLVEPK